MKNNLEILNEVEKTNIINPKTISIARQVLLGLEDSNQPELINISNNFNIVFEYSNMRGARPEIEISEKDVCFSVIENGYVKVKFYRVGSDNKMFDEDMFFLNKKIEWIQKLKNK